MELVTVLRSNRAMRAAFSPLSDDLESLMMMRILFVSLLVAAPLASFESVSFKSAWAQTPLAKTESTAARLYPPSTVLYAEISNPVELISLIFDHPLREKIELLEPYQMALKSPGYKQFLLGRTMVEGQLQMPWREALETFLANRFSLVFDAATQGGAIIVHGKDAESMNLLRDKALEFAKLGPNRDKIKQGEYRGVQAFGTNGRWLAVYEDRMLVTNKSDLGKGILDRMIDGGDSLADNPRFQTALESRDSGLSGWGFMDVQFIRDAHVADAFFGDQINNPVLELLAGGIQSTLKNTPFAAASLTANSDAIGLKIGMPFQADWIPEEREYFFGPSAAGRGPALASPAETLFTLSTFRDFSEMWLRAGDLYNTEINDDFAKADANLTTLFAGRDFGEDILGSFKSEVGFIATRNDLDDVLPRPTIKLPAFALVMELKEPESMTRELKRIFQSLLGFFNIIGAQNGQNQLEMDMEKIGDSAQLITSSYVPEEDDRDSTHANIVYNFSPSVGFAGERFVVSSSKTLARQLTLAKKPNPDTIEANTQAKLNAGVLRDVLTDNREQLISQNMLEDGNTREEAEAIIDLALQVVGYFQNASLRLGLTDHQLEAELKIQVQP